MIDFLLTDLDQAALEKGVARFRGLHPDENWTVTGMKGGQGLTLTITGSRIQHPAKVIVHRVFDMADSIYTALEQFREKLT